MTIQQNGKDFWICDDAGRRVEGPYASKQLSEIAKAMMPSIDDPRRSYMWRD